MHRAIDLPDHVFNVFMTFSIVIVLLGSTMNAVVCFVIAKFPSLYSSTNFIIFSMCLSDFMCSTFATPLIVYSNYQRMWPYSHSVCSYYAAGTMMSGLVSITHLAAGSVQRWLSFKNAMHNTENFNMSQYVRLIIGLWVVSIFISLCPLMGWSQFEVEGIGTSCSLDFTLTSYKDRSFVIALLVFFYLIPLGIIFYSSWAFVKDLKRITEAAQENWGERSRAALSSRKQQKKMSVMFSVMVIAFIVSWTPYAVISFIGFCGAWDKMDPLTASIPAYIVKSSMIYNPIIYALMYKKFRKQLRSLLAKYVPCLSNNTVQQIHLYSIRNGNSHHETFQNNSEVA